jgi:hypothetical protein
MKEAPPIVGPLEFAGLSNSVILIEKDEDDESLSLLREPMCGKNNIIFSSDPICVLPKKFNAEFTANATVKSIAMVHRMIKSIDNPVDFYLIDRVDLMNLDFSKRERGSQMKAYISMLCSHKTLRGANLIVTSCNSEYTLREVADVFISLRK